MCICALVLRCLFSMDSCHWMKPSSIAGKLILNSFRSIWMVGTATGLPRLSKSRCCALLKKYHNRASWPRYNNTIVEHLELCEQMFGEECSNERYARPKRMFEDNSTETDVSINNDMPVWLMIVLSIFVLIGLAVIGYVIKLIMTKDAAKVKGFRSRRAR